MNGSGRLSTEYSVGVCRDPADYQPNIHLVYAGVRHITNWIFINWLGGLELNTNSQNDQIRWVGIEYSIVDQIRHIRIKYLILGMIGLGRLEFNI
jgi:hypothetical protein